jgi:hypothetical protein
MTETPTTVPTQSAAGEPPHLSLWGKIHSDSVHGWEIFSRMFPVMEKIALNPEVDELFTEALRALGDGVAADRFHAATDLLRGARYRQQAGQQDGQQDGQPPAPAGTGPHPQFTPAPDGATAQLPVAPGAA